VLFLQLYTRITTFKDLKTAIYVRYRYIMVYILIKDYYPEISLLIRTLSRVVIFYRLYYFSEMTLLLINI
jgi:hypothetical protein